MYNPLAKPNAVTPAIAPARVTNAAARGETDARTGYSPSGVGRLIRPADRAGSLAVGLAKGAGCGNSLLRGLARFWA